MGVSKSRPPDRRLRVCKDERAKEGLDRAVLQRIGWPALQGVIDSLSLGPGIICLLQISRAQPPRSYRDI